MMRQVAVLVVELRSRVFWSSVRKRIYLGYISLSYRGRFATTSFLRFQIRGCETGSLFFERLEVTHYSKIRHKKNLGVMRVLWRKNFMKQNTFTKLNISNLKSEFFIFWIIQSKMNLYCTFYFVFEWVIVNYLFKIWHFRIIQNHFVLGFKPIFLYQPPDHLIFIISLSNNGSRSKLIFYLVKWSW